MRDLIPKQFLWFLVTGGIAAVVNFFSRILLNEYFSFSTSVMISYLAGMFTAFALADIFVFKGRKLPMHRSVLYFSLVNSLAITQTWLVSMSMANYLLPSLGFTNHIQEISHAFGISVPVFTSYYGHKYWSFR